MAFLTDRKRATGLGAAKSGTQHHWAMMVSSAALLVLVPLFIFTFGPMLGEDHATVSAYFARPLPALIALLTLVVSLMHFKKGVQVLIEDYVPGKSRKLWLILMTCISYAAMAAAIFAIARIAL